MILEQRSWSEKDGWQQLNKNRVEDAELVLAFGSNEHISNEARFKEMRNFFPNAKIISGSTAGEILGTEVSDNTIVVTAIKFSSTRFQAIEGEIGNGKSSSEVGKELASSLEKEGLIHAMVFSDGLRTNGTDLVHGIISVLPGDISVTGGLVGGGTEFEHTYVGLDHVAQEKKIVLIGFYGDNLKIGYGSMGGWDPFGPARVITKSEGNKLFELDGKPALEMYKKYLGDKAEGLPGTGLLFPLNLEVKQNDETVEVVRTILAVDEEENSLTFAGEMPEGHSARLMKANFERLIDGAEGAAKSSVEHLSSIKPDLAILVSCIGRKLVLKDRIEEEVEAVEGKLGVGTPLIGFYSYGELCPTSPTEKQCQMHNQTMTITTLREI